jgi:hypothetical protein
VVGEAVVAGEAFRRNVPCVPRAYRDPPERTFAQVSAPDHSLLRHLRSNGWLTCAFGFGRPLQSADSPHEPPSPHRWRLVCSCRNRARDGRRRPAWSSLACLRRDCTTFTSAPLAMSKDAK